MCTDLTQEAFEKATGLLETDRKWDNMDSTAIKKFLDNGCANSSVLAFNSNCNVRTKGGAYYSLSGATGSWPKRASAFGFPGRGQVWNHTHAHVIDGKHSNDSEGENITAVEIDVEN